MPPLNTQHQHRRHDSQSSNYPRASILPHSTNSGTFSGGASNSSTVPGGGMSTMSPAKTRQYAHLHSQLAQLNANLADTENLLRMTAVQAGDMRFLGGYIGALFMGSAKVLGEEGVRANADLKREEGSKSPDEGGQAGDGLKKEVLSDED
ncbi:hypothetical protein N7474_002436 [Penicillium riverlandense]|uniref:uncharacterized protein n=1 Tax=Penicillium riverlandense TaxID=1903569 RepID=UPI002546F9E6|nr:uncharacterized protein N7474_002436 [Penicillium riverlandense]KAJ5825298.1 hypothetical protein N7474_002436 [Penicillium riverlandense]